ncbi:MAG TPA: hypothetical protein VEA61_03325 [Allosphingosinicella sp.]|nr:hypothetical protein [Allosphingosinicella sp.]
MLELVFLLILTFGTSIVAAMAAGVLLDWLAPDRSPRWWVLLAGWWYPLLALAYGSHWLRANQCEPGDECGRFGGIILMLLGIASILTGFLPGPFAARITLRYLRTP